MKTTEKNSPVRISGISNAGIAFGIKEDGLAHIFNVLRNQLYSNKVLAVIREYSCNAYDAHIEAGNKAPICVTCPTILSPNFIVRDYGTGLSPEQIQEIYAFYGESTKRNTNEQIGQLGLGSKSGFAYGENFVINSYYNGIRYSYNAFIDASKKGQILLMDESGTEESNGVEIIIPVRLKDIPVFESTIISFFKHFNPKPDIINIDQDKLKAGWEIGNVELEGDSWKYVFKRNVSHWSDHETTMIVMGNIAYPLDVSAVLGLNECFSANFIVQFPIGSLEIAASRESLQYSQITQQAIKQRFDSILKDLKVLVQNRINKAETLFEAKANYSEVFSAGGSFSRFASFFKANGCKWNGLDIHDDRIFCTDKNIFNKLRLTLICKSSKSDRIINRSVDNLIIRCNVNYRMYVDDVGGKFMQRLAHYVHDRDNTNIHGIFVISFDNDAAKQAWLASTGVRECELKYASSEKINKIKYSTDCVSGPKDVKHNSSAAFVLDLSLNRSYLQVRSSAFIQKTFDLEAGGVYLHIDKFYCNPEEGEEAEIDPINVISLLKNDPKNDFFIEFPEIACFKTETISKIKSNPKWKSLRQYIIDWTSKNWSNQNQRIADFISHKNFIQEHGSYKVNFIKNLKCSEDLKNFSDHLRQMEMKNGDEIIGIFRKTRTLSMVTAPKVSYDLEAEFKKILQDNPILNMLDYYHVGSSTKVIAHYISSTGRFGNANENSEKTA